MLAWKVDKGLSNDLRHFFLAVTTYQSLRGPPRAPRRFPMDNLVSPMDNLVSHVKSTQDILLRGIVWRPGPLCFAQVLNLRNDKMTKFVGNGFLGFNQNFPIVWFPYLRGTVPRRPGKAYVAIILVDTPFWPFKASMAPCGQDPFFFLFIIFFISWGSFPWSIYVY